MIRVFDLIARDYRYVRFSESSQSTNDREEAGIQDVAPRSYGTIQCTSHGWLDDKYKTLLQHFNFDYPYRLELSCRCIFATLVHR